MPGNRTPGNRDGDTAMHFLEIGYKAPAVIDALVAGDPYAEYRQLGVIDDDGFIAARNGEQNRDGQLRTLLIEDIDADQDKLVSLLHYNGMPINSGFVVDGVLSEIKKGRAA